MPDKATVTYVAWILILTAFAAGTVDMISCGSLGGVFACAMTSNFALLAYYVAQSDSQAAMGSVVALLGFAIGCGVGALLRRGRAQEQALNLLLGGEVGLLLFFCTLRAMDSAHGARALGSFADSTAGHCHGRAGRHRPVHQCDHHCLYDHLDEAGGNHCRLDCQR